MGRMSYWTNMGAFGYIYSMLGLFIFILLIIVLILLAIYLYIKIDEGVRNKQKKS